MGLSPFCLILVLLSSWTAIVVFEAGSTDGSLELLESWRDANHGDNLVLLKGSEGRSSFSEGVNAACAEALARFPNARWLLFYETDNYLSNLSPIENAITV